MAVTTIEDAKCRQPGEARQALPLSDGKEVPQQGWRRGDGGVWPPRAPGRPRGVLSVFSRPAAERSKWGKYLGFELIFFG